MKILHINYSSSGGGAAIAARRLNDAMKRAGMESTLITKNDLSSLPARSSLLQKQINKIQNRIYRKRNPVAEELFRRYHADFNPDTLVLRILKKFKRSIKKFF